MWLCGTEGAVGPVCVRLTVYAGVCAGVFAWLVCRHTCLRAGVRAPGGRRRAGGAMWTVGHVILFNKTFSNTVTHCYN